MIRTPLGQWINPNTILKAELIPEFKSNCGFTNISRENNVTTFEYKEEDRAYQIQLTLENEIIDASDYYETKEEAQTALDKMFGKNESESIDLKDIVNGEATLLKNLSDKSGVALFLSYSNPEFKNYTISIRDKKDAEKRYYFDTLQEAIQKFNNIEI